MFIKGMIAGFIGTLVLSALMVMKSAMGLVPELDPVGMLAMMLGGSMAIGWLMHFAIGTIAWGGGFALTYNALPTHDSIAKGVIFGIAAWLAMMIIIMPMAGEGLFGLAIGIIAPVMTLMLHVIFGAVMGYAYAKQTDPTIAHA